MSILRTTPAKFSNMKSPFLILLCSLSVQCLLAQYHINASYIISDVTVNNISIGLSYNFKGKHQVGIGLKYHINNDSTKTLFRPFYQNQYSDNFINKVGIVLEYRLNFRVHKVLQPYLFYNFQFSRIGSKFHESELHKDSMNKYFIIEKQTTFDPINYFENHIGLGLNIEVNKHFALFSGFSAGVTIFTDIYTLDDYYNGINRNTGLFANSSFGEFSWLFNIGTTYKINKRKEKAISEAK